MKKYDKHAVFSPKLIANIFMYIDNEVTEECKNLHELYNKREIGYSEDCHELAETVEQIIILKYDLRGKFKNYDFRYNMN